MDLLNYINENMLILIPVIAIFGVILKGASCFKDKYIPFALLIVAFILVGITTRDIYQAIVQGTLVTGVAVLGSQLHIQSKKDE